MQKQRQTNLLGKIELRGKVLLLLLHRGEEQPVIVQAYLAKGRNVAAVAAGQRESFELVEIRGNARLGSVEVLGVARVDADCAKDEASC
jgi:hypothetical protein